MKKFDELPFDTRPDLTPYLIHLTKTLDNNSAFNNLVSILKEGKIRGSSADGYIRSPHTASCFMDVPIHSLKYVITDDNKHRYEAYGILIKKQSAYDSGARPVLYISNEEIDIIGIKSSQLWRVVRFEVKNKKWISWLHEREWRAKGDFKLPKNLIAVFVETSKEAQELQELIAKNPKAFKTKPRSIIPLNVVCQGLVY